MSKNPYKVVTQVFTGLGYGLIALVFAFGLYAFVAAAWDSWGAWALTIPILIFLGAIVLLLVSVVIATTTDSIASWWRKRTYEWDRNHRKERNG